MFLDRLLGPYLKTCSLLIKKTPKSLAKSVLIRLGLTSASSTAKIGTPVSFVPRGTLPIIPNEKKIKFL